jgi:hypothetical protein
MTGHGHWALTADGLKFGRNVPQNIRGATEKSAIFHYSANLRLLRL